MANKENKENVVLERIDGAIEKLKTKDFSVFFYVVDSKNIPNSSMEYTYNMALALSKDGYNVKMCYQLANEYTKEEIAKLKRQDRPVDENRVFTGVREWLGDEYADLEHLNIANGDWAIGPQDFLFIPEALSSLMLQTYKHHVPCKRIVILQNYDYVSDYIPLGTSWATFGINEAIAISKEQSEMLRNVFPYVKTRVLNPGISEMFRKPVNGKNLVVNVIAKNQDDINRVIKPFYWKYPLLNFVSFRDLRGKSQKVFAECLKESAITVWIDERTSFGMSALEAMRCGNIVIGKMPEHIPGWMGDETTIFDNGVWFTDMNTLPDIISSVVTSWMNDEIPVELTDAVEKTNQLYKQEDFEANTREMFKEIVTERINEITIIRNAAKNNAKEKNEE